MKRKQLMEKTIPIKKGNWYVCVRDLYNSGGGAEFVTGRAYLSPKDECLVREDTGKAEIIGCFLLSHFRPWTVQDAKPGDFLTYSSEDNKDWYLIYHSEYVPYENHYHYYACYADKFFTGGTACIDADYLRPSTPKERDLLLQMIGEAGYCWDAENRKLSKTADDEETNRVISDDMKVIPFNIKYRSQVESGEYRVVTRENCPVEIKLWDLKGDFPVAGVYYDEKNNRDTVVQVTAEGRCSNTPGEEYCDDFFIITNESELTEFRKELATMVDYAINHAKPGVNVVDIFADRIFDCAKLDMAKNLPTWKKSEKLIEGALLDRGILYIPRYMIELSELKKLPKEE